jgi:anionic cell wall polymer biosynthesis LytR-Cps2A-Psr (LCP) family protein
VDAVGGVQICLDKPMVDANSNINLPAGCQTLNGPNALGYVRQRYQDPQGDLGRVQRQRQVVGLIAKKAATPATLLNPKRYWDLSRAFSAALVRGTDTGLGDMFAAGRGMLAISQGNGLTLTVPVGDPNAVSPDGQSIVVWDHQRASEMFDEIARGDTSQLDQFVG